MNDENKIYTLKELKDKLTEKERIFCHQYIIDWNGARSAREAGYSKNTCRETAYENLTKPHIQQYIEFIKDDIEKEAGITKLKQVNLLLSIIEDNKVNIVDQIRATTELNKMLGYNAVIKTENKNETTHKGDININYK